MMTWIPYGPNAVLFRFAERVGDEAFALGRAIVADLENHPPPGLVELVPAFTTVLLEFDPRVVTDTSAVASELASRLERAAQQAAPVAPIKEVPVKYDGPDLDRVAREHGLTMREVAELHAAPVYKVYMLGFSPGFPYLGDLDPRLHTPRLASPRTRVPAGSVGIGGEHTGIYSVDSPGGWNIIGHTTVKLFDVERQGEEMFWLRAGDRVRFCA
jgi:KipI family sensor histidine kinase inhibitor